MNDSLKILESYVEIDKLHDEISNKLFNFINKANELVEASSDDYQLEKTLLLKYFLLKFLNKKQLCIISISCSLFFFCAL